MCFNPVTHLRMSMRLPVSTNDPLLFNSVYKFALQSLGVCNLFTY